MGKDEGARGASVLLRELEDGRVHADLSEAIRDVTKTIRDLVRETNVKLKGRVTLKLDIEGRTDGTMAVHIDIDAKKPKRPRSGHTCWVTQGGNLTLENPRQQKLQLHEVPPSDDQTRDIEDEGEGVRHV